MYYSTHTINTVAMNNVCSDGNVVAVYFIAMCSSNNIMTMPDCMWLGLQQSAMWAQKSLFFLSSIDHNLRTVNINDTKFLPLLQNLMGLPSEVYRNGILHVELNVKIQLSVICAHMVDFCRPGRICRY